MDAFQSTAISFATWCTLLALTGFLLGKWNQHKAKQQARQQAEALLSAISKATQNTHAPTGGKENK